MKAYSTARAVGGSLVVTIPKEIVRQESIRAGELLELDVARVERSFFGAARGIGPFTKRDELNSHD